MTAAVAIAGACIALAAQLYQLPDTALYALRHQEGGTVGKCSSNTNGTVDCGPFQVNDIWIETFTRLWDTRDRKLTFTLIRDSDCANTFAAAWILRQHVNETRSLDTAIAHYHSRTPAKGRPYRDRVRTIINKLE